jgi:hypothetical protein
MQKRLQLPERNAVEAMERKSAAKSRAGLSWSFSSVTVRYCRPAKGASNCEIVHSRLVERSAKNGSLFQRSPCVPVGRRLRRQIEIGVALPFELGGTVPEPRIRCCCAPRSQLLIASQKRPQGLRSWSRSREYPTRGWGLRSGVAKRPSIRVLNSSRRCPNFDSTGFEHGTDAPRPCRYRFSRRRARALTAIRTRQGRNLRLRCPRRSRPLQHCAAM